MMDNGGGGCTTGCIYINQAGWLPRSWGPREEEPNQTGEYSSTTAFLSLSHTQTHPMAAWNFRSIENEAHTMSSSRGDDPPTPQSSTRNSGRVSPVVSSESCGRSVHTDSGGRGSSPPFLISPPPTAGPKATGGGGGGVGGGPSAPNDRRAAATGPLVPPRSLASSGGDEDCCGVGVMVLPDEAAAAAAAAAVARRARCSAAQESMRRWRLARRSRGRVKD